MVKHYVLYQIHKYWLLFNALHATICINIKLQGEFSCKFVHNHFYNVGILIQS
jgi:hypothetical protein